MLEANHQSVSLMPVTFDLPLFNLIVEGSLEEIDYFLKGVPASAVNQGDDDDLTPLHLAVELNRMDIVKSLIEAGAEVNRRTLDLKLSPLHLSVRNGSTSITDLLLSKGADINVRNKIDHSPLHVAVSINRIEMARLLLFWGADVDVMTSDPRHETPLLKSSTISLPLTSLLLDSGAEVTLDLKEVHVALLANKPDIALMILNHISSSKGKEYKLKPNRIGKSHLQALTSHVTNCETKIVIELMKKLIQLGGDVNYSNHFGSLFHILISRTDEDEVAKTCFDYLLALDNTDCDQLLSLSGALLTPFSLSLELGHFYFSKQLLINGFIDIDRVTLGSFRYSSESVDTLKLLFYHGYQFSPLFCDHHRPTSDVEESSLLEFCSWLKQETSQVASLKNLVRVFLRSKFRRKCPQIVSNLPGLIRDFVLLK